MTSTDIDDVASLIDNITWLSEQIPFVIKNWKDLIKKCEEVVDPTGIIRDVCEIESAKSIIYDPLLKWLILWNDIRISKKALTRKSIDIFLLKGLNLIYRYAVFSNFLIRNVDFFVPYEDGGYETIKDVVKKRDDYEDFLRLINQKLIGCLDTLKFKFLPLLKTITTVEKNEDMVKKENYLIDTCLDMRRLQLRTT